MMKNNIPETNKNITIDQLNALNKNTVMESLGIDYLEARVGYVKGTMPVDARTIQPQGTLSGGASLAFAETLGGIGSYLLVDIQNYLVVGSQLSANHVGMAVSDKVIGEATLIHLGKKTHVWNIDIKNEDGKLVSTARLTNMIIKKKVKNE